MYKYAGQVIHQSHDDDGILEIIERNGVRSLHFGSSSKHSSIQVDDPDKLVLDYLRAMNAWLLFKETLDDALIIGLGGGSLSKFLLHHFPDCRLVVLENRKNVVKIARSYFGLPLDSRMKIIIDDGGHYIRKRIVTLQDSFSLLFIDAFDHDNMAASLRSIAFFDACRALLKHDGILVINLWNSDKPLFETYVQWLDRVFDGRVLLLPVKDYGNIICFAFNEGLMPSTLKQLRLRANELEQQFGIEFPCFLKALVKRNNATLNPMIRK
ncbi:MAG: spermine/spermidine synthase domain-containing protein [Gammaproteobacteria bacterium]